MLNFLDFCQDLPESTFDASEFVVREGEKGGNLYFLKSGSVEILKGDTLINTVLLPGSVIGEISALLGRPHLASVRATSKTVFYVSEAPDAFLMSHPNIALKIGRTLAGRVYSVSSQLAKQLAHARKDSPSEASDTGVISSVLGSLYETGGTGAA